MRFFQIKLTRRMKILEWEFTQSSEVDVIAKDEQEALMLAIEKADTNNCIWVQEV